MHRQSAHRPSQTPAAPDEQVIRHEGRNVHVRSSKEATAQAPTVVLLTGAGDTDASWAAVRAQLRHRVNIVSYDRSGMGRSDPGGERSCHGVVAELHAVIRGVVTNPVVLVGHSLGGLIALRYAAQHPASVAGLVLVDATPVETGRNKAVQAGFLISATLARLFKTLSPTGLVPFLLAKDRLPFYPEQAAFRAKVSQEDYRRWLSEVERNLAGNAGSELESVPGVAASANDVQAAASQHPERIVPTIILTSRAYGSKWVAMQQRMAFQFETALHLILPDRSHNIHMFRPELVAEAAKTICFWQDIEPADPLGST